MTGYVYDEEASQALHMDVVHGVDERALRHTAAYGRCLPATGYIESLSPWMTSRRSRRHDIGVPATVGR